MGIFSAFILQTCFQTGWRTVGTPSRHLLFSGDFCGSPDKDRTGFRIVIILNEYPGMVFTGVLRSPTTPSRRSCLPTADFSGCPGRRFPGKDVVQPFFQETSGQHVTRRIPEDLQQDRSSARRTAGRLEMSLKQIYFESEDAFFFPTERAAERIAERVAVSFA